MLLTYNMWFELMISIIVCEIIVMRKQLPNDFVLGNTDSCKGKI